MKKLSVIAVALIAVLSLSACGKKQKSADETTKPTKLVKLVNDKKETKLITKKGSIVFYKTYRGTSYDNNAKKRFDMVLFSYKATNNTNKMLTAAQIVNNTKLVANAKVDGKKTSLDQPLAYSSAYPNTMYNQQSYLNSFEQSWDNEPIKPHQTIIVTSSDAFQLVNNGKNETLNISTQDDYTNASVISKHHHSIAINDIHAKKVKTATDIVK